MTAIQQRTPAWHALRQVSIGSSDIAVLAGLSPWKSEYELAMEKLGRPVPDDRGGLDPRRVGELMEPVLLQIYREHTGRDAVKEHGVRTAARLGLPWAIASLDGRTIREKPNRIVELKHANAAKWRGGRLPEEVEVQCVWQMGTAGFDRADVLALIYGRPELFELTFDQSYFDDLVVLAERFRARLDAGLMPDPDGSDSARKAIAARYPIDDGSFMPASDETNLIALEIRDAEIDAKAAANREATAKNAMRALLGQATGVGTWDTDGYVITWKASKDVTTTEWEPIARAMAFENPVAYAALLEQHTTTKPGSRRLLARFDQAEGGDRP